MNQTPQSNSEILAAIANQKGIPVEDVTIADTEQFMLDMLGTVKITLPKKKLLTSHQLAKLLLKQPNLPIVTHAHHHTTAHDDTIRVGLLKTYAGERVVIGNFNPDGSFITDANKQLKEVYTKR